MAYLFGIYEKQKTQQTQTDQYHADKVTVALDRRDKLLTEVYHSNPICRHVRGLLDPKTLRQCDHCG